MPTYAIDNGDGDQITTGLEEHLVWRTAQQIADRRHETVYVYEVGVGVDSLAFATPVSPSVKSRPKRSQSAGAIKFSGVCARIPADPIGEECRILSIGREFLPPCAIVVLEGGKPTPEYWDWLCEQAAADETDYAEGL
jgi:hypothetical protein